MEYNPNLYHLDYKFSVTVYVDDPSALACLRGLAWNCQKSHHKMIAVSGTGEQEWIDSGRKTTFYFTNEAYREEFKKEFPRFFRTVKVVAESNEKPAPRSLDYR
jgi:hypothetical protein